MPTETLSPEAPVAERTDLADLVDLYTTPADLPAAEWMKRYHLTPPVPGLTTLNPVTRILKRIFDIAASLYLLVSLAPLFVALALLVKLSSRGPIIFKQVRVGLNLRAKSRDRRSEAIVGTPPPGLPDRRDNGTDRRNGRSFGKPFVIYKFRTMYSDAEKNGACLAVKGDPRITPAGWFLRKTRFDELPQLLNVLKGEMSLVGPRPERPEFIAELSKQIPGYLHRLRLRPGLTGLAQVVNGYDSDLDSFRKKVALDLLYLQNCSFRNDLKIILRTIGVVLTGKGAL